MPEIKWHETGEKLYETGIDRGVLFLRNPEGEYTAGEAWNGLTSVTESPSGAEPTKNYADNTVYVTLMSVEEFGATVECYTYPDSFSKCNGDAMPVEGVYVGQQDRETFGMSYRTLIGNDVDANNHGYKLHLVYGALASTTDKAYQTVNDTPEAMTFSYEISTTPVQVDDMKPTALLTIDSTKVAEAPLKALEDVLYGRAGSGPSLPLPNEVLTILGNPSGGGSEGS